MYKALNDFAPNYVSDLNDTYVPERNLRSAQSRQLVQPTYNLRTYMALGCFHALLLFYGILCHVK